MVNELGAVPEHVEHRIPSWAGLAIAVLGCLVVGAVAGWATAGSVETWYPTLDTPGFTPPDWVFMPVWILLYIGMGVAAWRVWERLGWQHGQDELSLFSLQLGLNGAWSILFFGLQDPAMALIDILVLLVLLVLTTWVFYRVDRWAGHLMVPYLAWVAFAAVLNASIWWLNR